MLFTIWHCKVCNTVTTKTILTSCGQNDTDVARCKQQKTVSISDSALQREMDVNTQHLCFLESALKPALCPLHGLNLSFQLLHIRLKTLQLFGTSLKKKLKKIVRRNLADRFVQSTLCTDTIHLEKPEVKCFVECSCLNLQVFSTYNPQRFLTLSSRSCERISSSVRFFSS